MIAGAQRLCSVCYNASCERSVCVNVAGAAMQAEADVLLQGAPLPLCETATRLGSITRACIFAWEIR